MDSRERPDALSDAVVARYAKEKATAEKKVSAGEEITLAELILILPGYDPRLTAEPGMYLDHDEAHFHLEWFPKFLRHAQGQGVPRQARFHRYLV